MPSPALGLSYYIWRRTRLPLISAALYLIILAAAVQLIPAIASPLVCVPLLAPLAAGVIAILGTLTLEQVNFDAAASVYPTHLLIRPATTRSLVAWPMLYAVIIAAGTVAMIDRLLLNQLHLPSATIEQRPINVSLPFIAAAFISWLQVVSWFPIPVPFGRLVAFTLTNLLVFAGNVGLYKAGAPQSIIALANVALVAAAFACAVVGVRGARRGVGQTPLPLTFITRLLPLQRNRRPFRSPAAAQLWFECRRNIFAPTVFACSMALLALPLSMLGSAHARKTGSVNLLTPDASIAITAPILILAFATAGPILVFLSMAAGIGKFDFFAKETRWPSFATIHPMSSGDFVRAKLKALAFASLITAAVMSIVVTISWLGMIPSDRALALAPLAKMSPVTRTLVLSLLPLAAALINWRNAAVSLIVFLTGRPRLITTFTFANIAMISLAFQAGYWLFKHPSHRAALESAFPALIVIAITIKLAVATTACRALTHLQLISRNAVVTAILLWSVFAIIAAVTFHPFAPSSSKLIPIIILMLPFTRLIATPLALHWNRHR